MSTSSAKKSGGLKAVVWWVIWITLTIVSFFAAAAFWTPWIAKHYGSIHESRNTVIWVTAVFGTWMIALIPLIILMYSKVDKAYEDARIRREKAARQFRSLNIPREKRLLPEAFAAQLQSVPPLIEDGHLVTVKLKDGRAFEHVYIFERKEILGIYDQKMLPFTPQDIESLRPENADQLPAFFASSWLRLDGAHADA